MFFLIEKAKRCFFRKSERGFCTEYEMVSAEKAKGFSVEKKNGGTSL